MQLQGIEAGNREDGQMVLEDKSFDALPSPLWVLGTDTGVGKTHVASLIARAWSKRGEVDYRKPFQTGVMSRDDPGSDAMTVKGRHPGILVESGVVMQAPLAPLAAAEREGLVLDLPALAQWTTRPGRPGAKVLLEGVGGVMVPLAKHCHFLAWATGLGLPAVVVARGGLGTLNHTLLTCEALMIRGWQIPCVYVNPGVDHSFEAAKDNACHLREFLPVPVEVLR